MTPTEFMDRLYRLHWRLRLRNPASDFEKQEWATLQTVMGEFRNWLLQSEATNG